MSLRSIYSGDRRSASRSNNALTRGGYGMTEQKISVTDILSEGPILGLKGGGQGIYLNNDNLFADQEVSYVGNPGETVSNSLSTDTTLTISGFNSFSYSTLDSKILIYEIQEVFVDITSTSSNGATWLALNIDWSSTDASETISTSYANTNTAFRADIGTDGTAIVTLIVGEKTYPCHIHTINNTSKTAVLISPIVLSDGDSEFTTGTHTIKISLWKDISSISGQTITLDSAPGVVITNKRFSITNVSVSSVNKSTGSSYQIRTGTKSQQPINTLYGVGSSTVALSNSNVSDLGRNQSGTITASGAQAGEIDKVQLIWTYPGGLYLNNTEKGKKEAAGAGYRIELELNDGTAYGSKIQLEGAGFITLSSAQVTDMNTYVPGMVSVGESIYAHGGKYVSSVSFALLIDLTPYQPYTGFRITVTRVTNSEDVTDVGTGRGHIWTQANAQGQTGKLRWRGGDVDKWQAVQGGGISQVFGIITEKLNFPYTAVANITFDSKAYSDVPDRTYDCYGMLVQVPDNYTTREEAGPTADGGFKNVADLYNGIWTGNFRSTKTYTDNPAWIMYDILINNRYGVGQYVNAADIDKYALYKIARYCDELVPDGAGGFEPRFRANIYLQKATDVYKVLKDMGTIFRGMLYWAGGKFLTVVDEKKAPVYTFTRANVINGEFNYETTGANTRSNQLVVKWNNPLADYKLEPLIIENRENILETGKIIREEATAFGCTSESQAIRYGRWKLWTALNQTELLSFKSSINSAFLVPGDIINIQDNHDYNLAYSGRISSVNGTRDVITVDRTVSSGADSGTFSVILTIPKVVLSQSSAIISSTTYNSGDEVTGAFDEDGAAISWSVASDSVESIQQKLLNAYDDDGNVLYLQYNKETTVKEFAIDSISGTDITLSTAMTTTEASAADGAIWGLTDNTGSDASYKQYKILSITKEDKGVYGFTCVEYYEGKFDEVDTNITLNADDPLFPIEDSTVGVAVPANLRILRTPKFSTPGEEITLAWDEPDYDLIANYQIEHSLPDYPSPLSTNDTSYSFENVPDGLHSFAVRTVTPKGRKSIPVIEELIIDDIFGGSEPRQYGITVGGYANSVAIVDTGTTTLKFEKDSVIFKSFYSDATNTYTFTSPSVDYSSLGAGEAAYIFADLANTTLNLVNYKFDTAKGVDYWYDVTLSDVNQWTTLTQTSVDVDAGSNKVVGTGTSFTSELEITNVILFSGNNAARVAYIESDTVLYIDRTFDSAISVSAAAKDELNPDFTKDFLIGRIDNSGNFNTYVVQDPNLGLPASVVLDVSTQNLTYNSSETQTNIPTNITATVYAINFSNPEYQIIIPSGMSEAGTSSWAVSAGADPNQKTFTLDDNGSVSYGSGGNLTVTASVREKNNTSDTVSTTFTITKSKDGTDGADGAAGATGPTGPSGPTGANGPSGFFYFIRTGTGTTTGTPGTDLGAPSTSEVASPSAGQIAVVSNSATPTPEQQGWRYTGSAWSAQEIVNQDIIFANAIGAEQLQISNSTDPGTGTYMYFDGTNNVIKIYDSGTLRVKVGNLA